MPFVCGYLGKITKDPEIKMTQGGKQICRFSIANEEGWGKNKKTDFIPCLAWDKTANTISTYFKKGDSIFVEGIWQNSPWQKNEKGYDIPNWQYTVKKVVFIPRQKKSSSEDDDFVPGMQIGTVGGNLDVEYSENDFVPIDDLPEGLPF